MTFLKNTLEFIISILVFYALYSISLFIHEKFFEQEDVAIFVLSSFLLSFLLIWLYRFSISYHVKRHAKEEVHRLYKTKEKKEKILRESIDTIHTQEEKDGKEAEEKKDDND